MGRRKKAAKKAVKKKRPVVAKVFKCLQCSTDGSVHCTLDYKQGLGQLECNVCKITYASKIHKLTQAIDLYTEWLDAAMELQTSGRIPQSSLRSLTTKNLQQHNQDRGENIRSDEERSVDSKSQLSDNFIAKDDPVAGVDDEDDGDDW